MTQHNLLGRPLLEPRPTQPYQPYHIFPKALSAAQCRRVIEFGLDLAVADATLEGSDGSDIEDHSIRNSKISWIPPTDDSAWIYQKVADVAQRANRSYQFELSGFVEDLQFTRYNEPGAFYSWHQDGLDTTLGHRKLSVVIQLSDPAEYEGSELQLFEVAEDYDDEQLEAFTHLAGQQGTAVVFPAYEYHRVLPLRAGCRLSLVSWISGPAFR